MQGINDVVRGFATEFAGECIREDLPGARDVPGVAVLPPLRLHLGADIAPDILQVAVAKVRAHVGPHLRCPVAKRAQTGLKVVAANRYQVGQQRRVYAR